MYARLENVSKTKNHVGVSVNDCRIFIDGSRVQERKQFCIECCEEFDIQEANGSHSDHVTKTCYEDTYFCLGWGHLEARIQTCLIQVLHSVNILC